MAAPGPRCAGAGRHRTVRAHGAARPVAHLPPVRPHQRWAHASTRTSVIRHGRLDGREVADLVRRIANRRY
jgi:hypothetical protein